MSSGLTATPLGGEQDFNWIFLIEILVIGVLAIFFLFYFNRLIGTIVSYGIRAWTWHKYRAYIDISALQISPLGGRIFFKSIRYHAHNITLFIHDGHITWRYWLRQVQEAEVFEFVDTSKEDAATRGSSASRSDHGSNGSSRGEKSRSRSIGREEEHGGRPKKQLPCRISVKVSGIEAFIYNRSPLFDSILAQTLKKAEAKPKAPGSEQASKRESDLGLSSESSDAAPMQKVDRTGTTSTVSSDAGISHEAVKAPEVPSWLRVFPIRIECKRAAAVVGNENTTSVITAKVERATGTIDAGRSGPLDLYKLLFNFDIETINAAMRPNRDFKQRQLDAAQRILREKENRDPSGDVWIPQRVRMVQKKWFSPSRLLRQRKSADGSLRAASLGGHEEKREMSLDLPGESQWHGLARYLDEEALDEHSEWQDVEYAKASTLADIDFLQMRFYFDMPGKMPKTLDGVTTIDDAYRNDMNGSKPPDYGLDFFVHGGVVTYGPWADRERINLQQIFFPASFVDAVPAERLRPGEWRTWSLFKIFVSVEEDVTLRIPSREPSKDDKWQGRAEKIKQSFAPPEKESKRKGPHGKKNKGPKRQKGHQAPAASDVRPYGWIDINVKADTTVNYTMDMYAGSHGYKNLLDVDAKATEITSSVNHGLLWKTGRITVVADLSQASAWNTLRTWPFDITINDAELFILRDHLFLIIDLVNDWSSGALSEFYTFVPYRYNMHLLFRNFCMYLNVNDANIISDPANFDKNDYLTLEGLLDANLSIDMEKYRPVRNMITFDLLATEMRMRMLSPMKSSLNTLLKEKQVATLPKLTLSGSYSGHIEQRTGLTDTLRFDIVGSGLTLMAYGFLVNKLVGLKENYFGDYMHFKTVEEFQEADDDPLIANLKTASLPKPKSINELDVILCIIAEDATVLLPTNIYSGEEFVRIELPVANLDLRILSYYLDMGLQLSPISILSGKSTGDDDDDSMAESDSSTQLFVKHVDLDGHRSFGLPPNEPAYLSQWNIGVGAITGEFSSAFIHDLAMAAKAFVFSFPDLDNALPLASPTVVNDVTFVQVHTDTLRVWMHLGQDAILFAADPIEVSTNDWAGELFSQRIKVLAPKITFAVVDARSAFRQRTRKIRRKPVRTYAFIETGACVVVTQRAAHFAVERRKQQAHIRTCDARTQRAPFLLYRDPDVTAQGVAEMDFEPPCMPYPSLPPPLDRSGRQLDRPRSVRSFNTATSGKSLPSKSSSSSLSLSLRSGGLTVPSYHSAQGRLSAIYGPSIRSKSPPSTVSSRPETPQRLREKSSHPGQLGPSTVAFSNPYSEPYFSLDTVEPDETLVPPFLSLITDDDNKSEASASSEVNNQSNLDINVPQTSVLINLIPGVRAYVEPEVAQVATKLLQKISPQSPAEVMDAFQIDALGALLASRPQNPVVGKLMELDFDLASVALRVVNPNESNHSWDQVDIGLRSIETMVRMRTEPTPQGAKDTVALHTLVGSIGASLGEKSHHAETLPAVKADVKDVLIWVAAADVESIHVTLGDTNLAVAGEQAEFLTGLALRLMPLVNNIITRIQKQLLLNSKRLLLLVQTLMQTSDDLGDPRFLSSLTDILRSFPGHPRSEDSWKVVMRLRHQQQGLLEDANEALRKKYGNIDNEDISGLTAKDLESWAQWRNWDIPNVRSTLVMESLFRLIEGKLLPDVVHKRLALTVRSEFLRVAIEAAQGANEIIVEDLSLGVEQTPPSQPTGLLLADENTRRSTIIQLHLSSIAIGLDWSAFVIAEAVIPCISELQRLLPAGNCKNDIEVKKTLDERLNRDEFHLVVSADNSSLTIKSIHLRHRSYCDNLKLSLIGTTQASDRYGQCVSSIVNATTAITELYGPDGRRIWRTRLTSPSIYADSVHSMPEIGNPVSVVVALGYRDLQLAIEEQAPKLLNIVDSVMLDEVGKILHLVDSAKSNLNPISDNNAATLDKETTIAKPASIGPRPEIQVALLAGKIRIELALLSTLLYKLEGTAASVRVAPSASEDHTLSINFDVGGQHHAFVNISGNEWHEQGVLDVPPLNGHIGLQMLPDITSLSVAATMDKVLVDAAAIYGLAGVFERSEVKDVISDIQHSLEDIKLHAAELKPAANVPVAPGIDAPSKPLAFDVKFALLGIRIAAKTTPARSRTIAEISFGFGPLHAYVSNRSASPDNKVLLPQLHAQVQNIGANLEIHCKGNTVPCGNMAFSIEIHFNSHVGGDGKVVRELVVKSGSFSVNAYPETASTAIHIINHLQDRLKLLDLSREVDFLRSSRSKGVVQRISGRCLDHPEEGPTFSAEDLLSIQTTVDLRDIKVAWLVDQSFAHSKHAQTADLVLSLKQIQFTTRAGRDARLTIDDLQLSMIKRGESVTRGSLNSALLSNMSFGVAYWSSGKQRSLALRAAGKPLELRLESNFVSPVNAVQKSITAAVDDFKLNTANWKILRKTDDTPRAPSFDIKRLGSLLVEADFAGASVYIQGTVPRDRRISRITASTQQYEAHHGRYGQFAGEGALMQTSLQAPGIALKCEYNSNQGQASVNGELLIDASSNMLLPTVVPLMLEITHTLKDVMRMEEPKTPTPSTKDNRETVNKTGGKFFEDDSIVTADPTAIFGRTKVNLGMRICRQEFGLSCQPIARVDATAGLEDFYITMNTVHSEEHGHFFAVSAVVTKLNAQVKHMYSREPTFSFEMDSITLSVLNNKHLSGTNGISAVLKIDPTRMHVNAKQLQDLLLFREIWAPPEIRSSAAAISAAASQSTSDRPEDVFARRYQAAAATAAFPWNATIYIAELAVDLDLGQSIGKSSFSITKLWASQAKSSDSEQNLCIGMSEMAINSTGRMSGFVKLGDLNVRTTIRWPDDMSRQHPTPLIQASIGFQRLRAKAAFDYQAFAFGDIEGFDFLMYNVRETHGASDRLAALLDCEKAYIFCTSTSPAQAVGLYQAFDRLIQEKQIAFKQSLRDIEKHLRRESTLIPTRFGPAVPASPLVRKEKRNGVSLHTDVVVTIGTICFGVFPTTFFDSQILKLEANNIQDRFAVSVRNGKIHSGLSMTLGQLHVALASVRRMTAVPKALDINVDDVINSAVNAKGGVILRVPKVVVAMETWQASSSNQVDYIFKSLFAGKIDVGWNLSRINFIKNMWMSHSRSLASRLGKALPESAVKITAGPTEAPSEGGEGSAAQEKITAEVNLPQSRYEYRALEPAIIETPQLRDMGEATPPLEWIGLHRDRLPNVTHQILIMSLLEVAKEVEDAYEKILGSS